MRLWQPILAVSAMAALSAPAAAQSHVPDVFVPIGYSDSVILLVKMSPEPPLARNMRRALQIAYYATPSFSLEGVPIRLTETEFEIDCANGATRRLNSSAYRDIGDRVGSESYSESWVEIADGDHAGTMRRLACNGLSPQDAFFSNLRSAVRGSTPLLSTAAAE